MQDRDEIAKRHGCASGDELLAISEALPMLPCDVQQIFIARPPNGDHFVWVGEPQSERPSGRKCQSADRDELHSLGTKEL